MKLDINILFKSCNKCNRQYPKVSTYFINSDTCNDCKNKTVTPIYNQDENKKEYLRNRMKNQVANISDEYLINLICKNTDLKIDDVKKETELLELKRSQIKLKRELKKWNITKNT